MNYKEGSFDAAKFKEIFGLKGVSEGKAYSEGSTTGTKQVGALGTYLTEKDYNRLKDSDEVRDAYTALRGEEAAEKKFAGGEGLSINTLDALFDDLSKGAPKESNKKEKDDPIQYSQEKAQSKAYVDAYRDFSEGGGLTEMAFGSAATGYKANPERAEDLRRGYADNIKQYLKPDPVAQRGKNLDDDGNFKRFERFSES